MDSIDKILCRFCLSNDTNLINLFGDDAVQMDIVNIINQHFIWFKVGRPIFILKPY